MQKCKINCILCYISLNEKVILSDFFLKDGKTEKDKALLDQIKISNKAYIKFEKFKKSCYKLNDLIDGIDKIKKIYYEKNKDILIYIDSSFSDIVLQGKFLLKKDIKTYFSYLGLPTKDIYRNNISEKPEFILICLKNEIQMNDKIEEKLMKLNINTKIIIIDEDEKINKEKSRIFKKLIK